MTTKEIFGIMAAIYIAPHVPRSVGLSIGGLFVLLHFLVHWVSA